jgi:hypothetical protein
MLPEMPDRTGRPLLRLRRFRLLLGLIALVATPAFALDVKECQEAGVGLQSIAGPVEKAHMALYEGKVDAYAIDTVEPACCASGIAIVMPAVDDPSGGSDCWAVIGLASIDVRAAKRSYDKAKGLLLVMPTKRSNESGDAVEGPPLRLRINLGQGTVTLE